MAKRFLWGAGISAHQTEGHNTNSDWWDFEQHVLAPRRDDVSGPAVDHWNQYKKDIDLLASAGLNTFRISVEWARIEPEKGKFDQTAIKHYQDVLAYCKSKKIKTIVTLWHFTLPKWIADQGGWFSRDSQKRFLTYVEVCRDAFKSRTDYWITLNEPMVYLHESYRWGHWPPQERSVWKVITGTMILAHAHLRASEILEGTAPVGIAKSFIAFEYGRFRCWLIRQNPIFGYKHLMWNLMFYAMTMRTHDFIGINYYFTSWHRKHSAYPKDDMGWELRPEGLETAMNAYKRLNLPFLITENGTATTNDAYRKKYIKAHVEMVQKLRGKYRIIGYIYWSLLDNFEWDKGWSKQFGLIAVDRKTMKRTPKPSLAYYGELIKKDLA